METDYAILIILGVLLVLIPLTKSALERVGVPPLAGYILLGFLLSALNEPLQVMTPTATTTFELLAQLGVVALLFHVGLKSRIQALLAKLPQASFIWVGDVLASASLSFLFARFLLGFSVETSAILATAFSATSVAVSVAVWDEMHKLRSATGQLLVDVSELDDLSSVLMLAVLLAVLPIMQGEGGNLLPSLALTTGSVLVKLALFITGCYLFSHYFESDFTRFHLRWGSPKTGLTIPVLGAGLAIAAIAGSLGFSLAIGALFAGLAFSRDPDAVHSDGRFTYFYEFLTPFFFIHIGMQIEPASLPASLGLAAILLVPAVLGKLIGVGVAAIRFVDHKKATMLGLSMIPRAEIAMVVVYQCHQLDTELVSNKVFSAVVAVSVATSILSPLILRSWLSRKAKA